MRITSYDKYNLSQNRLSQLQQYSNDLQVQITTGKAFQKISQSPVQANVSLLVDSGIKQIDQFSSNLQDLQGYVQTAESYLGTGVEDFQRGLELATKASSGTYNADDRKSFELEVENLIEHMVGLGNSKYLGKYLFSGQSSSTQALSYDGTSVTYNGSDNVNSIRISSSMDLKTSVTAKDAFQGTIESLISLRDAIKTGDSSTISGAMDGLEKSGETLINYQSEMGVRMNTVKLVSDAYDKNKLELQTRKSKAEDIDMSEAITKFMTAQQLYQGSVSATLKMYQSSLLNFMN